MRSFDVALLARNFVRIDLKSQSRSTVHNQPMLLKNSLGQELLH